MCVILNFMSLIAFGAELWFDMDVIENKKVAKIVRAKYVIRLVIAAITLYFALMIIYKALGVTDESLGYYIRYGNIR